MKYLLLIFFFFSHKSFAQLKMKGSFIIAAICKDGIVIAEDSRASIYHPGSTDSVETFFDPIQKIHVSKNFAFGSVGQLLFDNRCMISFLRELESRLPVGCDVIFGKDQFLQFIYTNYPKLLAQFLKVKLVFAGYHEGKPTICKIEDQEYYCIEHDGWLTTDTRANFQAFYNPKITCSEMADRIEKCIKEYVIKYNMSETVGGPIMALQIKPDNTVHWLKNEPLHQPHDNAKEIYKAYKNGQLNIYFKSSEARDRFEAYYGQL